jgi:putative ABC transport system substrate-binding protein
LGLAASQARPGGNVTGLSMQQTELAGKRLELLRVPGLRRLAIMANADAPPAVLEMVEVQATARALGSSKILAAADINGADIKRSRFVACCLDEIGHGLKGAGTAG